MYVNKIFIQRSYVWNEYNIVDKWKANESREGVNFNLLKLKMLVSDFMKKIVTPQLCNIVNGEIPKLDRILS